LKGSQVRGREIRSEERNKVEVVRARHDEGRKDGYKQEDKKRGGIRV